MAKSKAVKSGNPKNKDAFFVGVPNSTDVRKELLTTSKQVIVSLKRYEKFKTLRSEKIRLMFELKKNLKELDFLNQKLKQALPKSHLRATHDKKPEQEVSAPIKATRSKKISELDKLENQLSAIESKIKGLE